MASLVVLFLLVGAAGGFTAGLFGVGGGLVIVPTLFVLWHADPILGPNVMHHAVATSLACIVVTSVTSSWVHWRAKRNAFTDLSWLMGAVSVGSLTAVWLASWVSTEWLKIGFGAFALTSCITLLRKKNEVRHTRPPHRSELLGVGGVIGHVSTLLGVSGGAMTVPYLVLRGMDIREAVVVSSALAIPISLIGSVGLAVTGPDAPYTLGYVHWPAFLGISSVSVLFAKWGARWSQRMDKAKLKMGFALFLLMVALQMLLH